MRELLLLYLVDTLSHDASFLVMDGWVLLLLVLVGLVDDIVLSEVIGTSWWQLFVFFMPSPFVLGIILL